MVAACDRVVVVLGARAGEIRAGVDLQGAEAIVFDGWPEGPFASLQCGLRALGDAPEVVVVALGDQPGLTAERIDAVLAFDGPIVRAWDGGAPSHPVVIRRGAALTHETMRSAPGPDLGALADVDTPADLRE